MVLGSSLPAEAGNNLSVEQAQKNLDEATAAMEEAYYASKDAAAVFKEEAEKSGFSKGAPAFYQWIIE